MPKSFLGSKILVLTAHPDDESYACAGTLHANHQHGGTNFLICATAGENGSSHLTVPTTKARLKKIRTEELQQAAECLCVNKLMILHFTDGKLRHQKLLLLKKILPLAKKYQPDIILSFGADGLTGHYDHLAANQVARRIANKLQTPFAAFAFSPKFSHHAIDWLRRRRRSHAYTKTIIFTKPNLKIKINRAIKKEALSCHISQHSHNNPFYGYPDYAIKEMLKYEYFVVG